MIAARLRLLLLALGLVAGAVSCGTPPVTGWTCLGVPESMCKSQLADAERNAPPGAGAVVGIRIRCTAATCTEQAGEVEVTATYANGQTVNMGMGWNAAPAAPAPAIPEPLPMAPVCLGVPSDWCRIQAATGPEGGGTFPADLRSITVRCKGTCSPTTGEGSTEYILADGTSRTIQWTYDGDAP